MENPLDSVPIYCSRCREKTDNVAGSGILRCNKNNKNKVYGSACCVKCLRRKNQAIGKGILNDWISKNPLGIEKHLIMQPEKGGLPRKASFAGPGTNLNRRLKNYDKKTGTFSKVITPPINKIDEAALEHDVCYGLDTSTKHRNECDKVLSAEMVPIINNPKTTSFNRLNAKAVKAIMDYKIKHKI